MRRERLQRHLPTFRLGILRTDVSQTEDWNTTIRRLLYTFTRPVAKGKSQPGRIGWLHHTFPLMAILTVPAFDSPILVLAPALTKWFKASEIGWQAWYLVPSEEPYFRNRP